MITNTTNTINIGNWTRTTINDKHVGNTHLWIRVNELQESPVVECKELMQFLNDDEV